MITEDYVSFEIAKLLKDKRFPQNSFKCHYIITDDGYYKSFEDRCGFGDYDIIAPTLAMAMKWLREVYNIDISVTPDRKNGYSVLIFKDKRLPFDTLDSYSIYEQACEAAIKYCLENLI